MVGLYNNQIVDNNKHHLINREMLICSIALVLLVAAIAESTVPIFHPSQQSFAFKDVDSVCSESYYNLKGLFAGVKMEGSFVEDGIAIKPAEGKLTVNATAHSLLSGVGNAVKPRQVYQS